MYLPTLAISILMLFIVDTLVVIAAARVRCPSCGVIIVNTQRNRLENKKWNREYMPLPSTTPVVRTTKLASAAIRYTLFARTVGWMFILYRNRVKSNG